MNDIKTVSLYNGAGGFYFACVDFKNGTGAIISNRNGARVTYDATDAPATDFVGVFFNDYSDDTDASSNWYGAHAVEEDPNAERISAVLNWCNANDVDGYYYERMYNDFVDNLAYTIGALEAEEE